MKPILYVAAAAVVMAYDPLNFVANFYKTRKRPFKGVIDNTGTGAIARAWATCNTPHLFSGEQAGTNRQAPCR